MSSPYVRSWPSSSGKARCCASTRPVDPCFELSAFLSAADAGPAVLFERIWGRRCAPPEICSMGASGSQWRSARRSNAFCRRLRQADRGTAGAGRRRREAPVQSVVIARCDPLGACRYPGSSSARTRAVHHRGRHRRARPAQRARQPVVRPARHSRWPARDDRHRTQPSSGAVCATRGRGGRATSTSPSSWAHIRPYSSPRVCTWGGRR